MALTRHLFACSLLATAAACSNTTAAREPVILEVATNSVRYAPGDSMRITLRNAAEQRLQYLTCSAVIERQEGASWVIAWGQAVCALQGKMLAPGETVEIHLLPVPEDARPGIYRLRYPQVADRSGQVLSSTVRTSNTFEVISPVRD